MSSLSRSPHPWRGHRRASWRRLTFALAGLGLVVPLATACGGDDEGPDEAGGEGTSDASQELVIYSGRNEELIDPLLERLEEATGTTVTVRYGDSAELAAQILEEGERTNAGLFLSQDAGALGALAEAGLLTELPREALDQVEPTFRAEDGSWVGVSGRARIVAYAPEQVGEDELPQELADLTDPRWSGEVGYAPTNASFQSFVTAMRVLEGEDATRRWLEDLRANDAQAFDGNGPILDAVNSGELAFGLINHYYVYELAAEVGEDEVSVGTHYLPGGGPGSLVNVAGVGITAYGGQEAAAQEAVDFLLSEEAQTYFAEETFEYPLAAGVTSPVEELPSLESLEVPDIDLSDLATLQETLTLLQDVGMV
ncbi:iron ABC transporter substrate-binding protein [Streptomyces radicis]|uniref:Iron ABC transporter substrate-binding protein n=1 Tax=Streptomyces radicis TaxID=1750517 RepID=A0A3A9WIH6_9ACTN|nr:iron ABC transporter substrate-binding protein [Streptomyces radicis]RKN12828.1 iron ABC transporter substrate-binding protein [Streptomyces radicis]RKN27407.1 iron ABC transporter substrate-binding protein [Streptomyces radicis]